MKRRNTLKLLSTLPLLFLPTSIFAQGDKKKNELPNKQQAPKSLLDENDTLAKALHYKHDANKASALRTDKNTFCYNCSKYNVCMKDDKNCKVLDSKTLQTAEYAA